MLGLFQQSDQLRQTQQLQAMHGLNGNSQIFKQLTEKLVHGGLLQCGKFEQTTAPIDDQGPTGDQRRGQLLHRWAVITGCSKVRSQLCSDADATIRTQLLHFCSRIPTGHSELFFEAPGTFRFSREGTALRTPTAAAKNAASADGAVGHASV